MIRRVAVVLGLLLAIEAGCTVVPTDNPGPDPEPTTADRRAGRAP